jgi:enoyl-CoA hydratase
MSQHLDISFVNDGKVAIVALNRPKKFNACSWDTFFQLQKAMEDLAKKDVRAIVFTGNGKHFTAGLDLTSAMDMQNLKSDDASRAAFKFYDVVKPLQDAVTSLEKVRVPVIAAIHGYCIGAGVDLASACDIRLCAKNSQFTIKEVDIGLCADIGTI